MATTTTTPALALRSFEIMRDGTLADFEAIVHPHAYNHEQVDEPPAARGLGPAHFHPVALWLRAAYSELDFEIHETIADGDLVVVRATMTGRHTGPFVAYDPAGRVADAFPPTGRRFAMTQTHWFRLADGLILEHWANRDDLGAAKQLGWVPPGPGFLARAALLKRRARRAADPPVPAEVRSHPILDRAAVDDDRIAIALHSLDLMRGAPLPDFEAVIHPDSYNHEQIGDPPAARGVGPATYRAAAQWLNAAFAGLAWTVHSAVAEGDLVAVHCTMTGRHAATFVTYDEDARVADAFPPTGRRFATTQSHWFRIADGFIIEHWANRDDLGTALQLGWAPPSPAYLVRMALAKRRARRS